MNFINSEKGKHKFKTKKKGKVATLRTKATHCFERRKQTEGNRAMGHLTQELYTKKG